MVPCNYPKLLDSGVCLHEVELSWVEVCADPFEGGRVSAVGRVGHCIEEFAVAPRAAHIIRRTRIRSVKADGIFQPNRRLRQLFDDDLVFSGIAEVVLEGESVDVT